MLFLRVLLIHLGLPLATTPTLLPLSVPLPFRPQCKGRLASPPLPPRALRRSGVANDRPLGRKLIPLSGIHGLTVLFRARCRARNLQVRPANEAGHHQDPLPGSTHFCLLLLLPRLSRLRDPMLLQATSML